MPTPRSSMGVLSLQVALVVAGGVTSTRPCTTSVDIFKLDTLQWYRTDPLPMECCNLSMVSTGNTCYALRGYKYPIQLNQALYSSIDDLLHHAVLHNKTPHDCRGDSDSQSAWKTLPNIPSYRPTAAIVAGNLLAIGGMQHVKEELTKVKFTCTLFLPTHGSTSVIYLWRFQKLVLLFCLQ